MITTCSAGKRIRGNAAADRLRRSDQRGVADEWLQLLRQEQILLPARELYKGRAFTLTRLAAERIGASFGILSAGLGFVRSDVAVPGYDLTVQPGKSGSVSSRITTEFSPRLWWESVQQGPFASDLQSEAAEHDLVLVSLSKAYLDLVADDLMAIERTSPGKLRLFGLSLRHYLPASLVKSFMPYDARLDLIGCAGTRTDFAARALNDFLLYNDIGASASINAQAVVLRLAAASPPPNKPQHRVDDATVREAIRTFIIEVGHNSSKALAWLRKDRGMSCEQRRFANLYREIVKEQTP